MRTILVLLVAGCLLWLVLHGLHNVRAGSGAPPEPAGVLLPTPPQAEPATETPAVPVKTHEDPRPAAAAPAHDPAPAAAAAAAHSAPAMPVASPAAPPSPRQISSSPADELALASLLLHHTDDVPSFLEGPGKSIAPGRRDLALALHRLVTGREDEARRLTEGLDAREGVRVSESSYLKQALAAGGSPVPAATRDESPLIRAAALARVAREGQQALAAGKWREAALAYGELLLGEVCAPWKSERESLAAWSEALARAQAGYRWNPDGGWSSIPVKVESGDSLISVRKRAIKEHAELLVCTGEIARANGLRGEMIHPGRVLKVPLSRANVLVDVDARWALYRLGTEVVAAWEIGVGKPGSETPPGEYVVGEKTREPPWFRPGHAPVPYGDPENPLGTRWIAWQRPDGSSTGLGFHGTKDPGSIGEDQSQGCVRMRQAAIEELFEILPAGAAITVQP